MSNQLTITDNLLQLEKPFEGQNNFGLTFKSECLFAKQVIEKNDFALTTATNNPGSLKSAILNVAAIGISLNPALAHSYLVPRGGAICLDISFRGLIKLATDSGAIEWAKAELVYAGDEFNWLNMATLPEHRFNPFDDSRVDAKDPMKGLIGGYCVAQLGNGGYLVDRMTIGEIEKVRDTSKAGSGPWKTWPEEMVKKTLVKRASKSWPQSGGRTRLDQAIEVLNEHEGIQEVQTIQTSDYLQPSPEQTATYLKLAKGCAIDFWLWYNSLDQRVKTSLPGCEFEKGKKGETMAFFNGQLEAGRSTFETWSIDLVALIESGDDYGTAEFLGDIPENQREALFDTLNAEQAMFARKIELAA